MTVKELREVLLKYDDDLEVLMVHDAWCSVGSIEEGMIGLRKVDGDNVLVFDEDAIDDDDEDAIDDDEEDDDEWEWSNCRK